MKHIVCNKIKTPDGTVVESHYTHDYRTHRDKNGKVYMVAGGLEYLRRNVHEDAPFEELTVYSDAPHEIIRENFCWGTYGKKADKPLKWVLLCDMSDEHIKNVINDGVPRQHIESIFIDELRYRSQHDLHVSDNE